MSLLHTVAWGLCAMTALGGWSGTRGAEASPGAVAAAQLVTALRQGLEEHVVWLTPEERGEIERRMGHWLAQRLRAGLPQETLQALARQLRARPVPDTQLHSGRAGAREEWLLRSVDALKRAILRWVEHYPLADEERAMARAGAAQIAILFRDWLGGADPTPPEEELEAATRQLQRELVGAAEGALWAPILYPPTQEQIRGVERFLEAFRPPRWRGRHYRLRAIADGQELAVRLWRMQTVAAAPTAEGLELELARRPEPGAEQRMRALFLRDMGKAAQRLRAREEYGQRVSASARRTAVHPFLVQAFLRVRDALERRVLILP